MAAAQTSGRLQRPHRILHIAGFFPPKGPMGAIRPNKMHHHWLQSGRDVRTIAIDLPNFATANSILPSSVHYLPYGEPGRYATQAAQFAKRVWTRSHLRASNIKDGVSQSGIAVPTRKPALVFANILKIYRETIAFPDRYTSWIAPAVRLARSWAPEWLPDIVYSSGPPHSGHIAARTLAAYFRRPWIAGIRDLWAGNPYDPRHPLVAPFFNRQAQSVLSDASACVGVTQLACEAIGAMTNKPVLLAYNGYDPEDFEGLDALPPLDETRLTMLHAGAIYPGRRDPAPLFEAIASLGQDSRKIRCLFYHDADNFIRRLSQQHDITHCVEIHQPISRSEILRLERQVDILLECRWQDPSGDGVIPGKLFEYIGARRPILSIGSLSGEAADIVRYNRLGLVSNDPAEIAKMLKEWLAVKESTARLPDLQVEDIDRFQRRVQFRKIDALIESLIGTGV